MLSWFLENKEVNTLTFHIGGVHISMYLLSMKWGHGERPLEILGLLDSCRISGWTCSTSVHVLQFSLIKGCLIVCILTRTKILTLLTWNVSLTQQFKLCMCMRVWEWDWSKGKKHNLLWLLHVTVGPGQIETVCWEGTRQDVRSTETRLVLFQSESLFS